MNLTMSDNFHNFKLVFSFVVNKVWTVRPSTLKAYFDLIHFINASSIGQLVLLVKNDEDSEINFIVLLYYISWIEIYFELALLF